MDRERRGREGHTVKRLKVVKASSRGHVGCCCIISVVKSLIVERWKWRGTGTSKVDGCARVFINKAGT